MKGRLTTTLKIIIFILLPLSAKAGGNTTSTTMNVSASVAPSCTVRADPLQFGSYTLAQKGASATIYVTCTKDTNYDIGLDAGSTSGATVDVRKMKSGSNTLNYSIYQNSGYTTVWGETVGSNTVHDTGSGTEQQIPVYGMIPANQQAPIGSYTDTVNVKVTFGS